MPPLVAASNLAVAFPRAGDAWVRVVDGVSLGVDEGEAMGVVGESGCGKTVSALALLRLVPEPARIVGGSISLGGEDVLAASVERLGRLRGGFAGFVFQEPTRAFNPVRRISTQVAEAARLHRGVSADRAVALAEKLLAEVGLDDPARVARGYPHQLSGGQRQRVLLASALAADPRLLIADEPTSALDTVSQRHLVELLDSLRRQRKLTLVFISHDLPLVARLAERVTVLYAGETVEVADRDSLFAAPAHPYTRALVAAQTSARAHDGRFATVDGAVPRAGEWPEGCRFAPRCPLAFDRCRRARPALTPLGGRRQVRCFLAGDAEEPGG
ncbi:MAG TPA: ABC transporter ATP-binding protein [Thermoanaerobaculaceae bacterium]|nr:ABC transporter ATP-binding protein [Thermoanaerobaculaceae bacterium]